MSTPKIISDEFSREKFFILIIFWKYFFPGALKLCSKKGILNVPIAELWLPIINKFLFSNRSYNMKENIFWKIFLTSKIKQCIQAITSQHLKIRSMNLQLIWENKEKKIFMFKKVFILPSLTKFERKRGSMHLVISCVQINYSQITFQFFSI